MKYPVAEPLAALTIFRMLYIVRFVDEHHRALVPARTAALARSDDDRLRFANVAISVIETQCTTFLDELTRTWRSYIQQ